MALDVSGGFLTILGLSILSLVTTIIAYASPHWVDSFPNSNNPFLNAGLWEVCWNDYTFPLDLLGRRFVGCFWILGKDLYEFRDTILNASFISVIVLFTIQLTCQIITMVVIFCSWIRLFPRSLQYGIHYGCASSFAASAVLSFCGIALFGAIKEDRHWMYRPDQNILSWSFGFAICTMIFTTIAALLLLRIGMREQQERNKGVVRW